VAEPGWLTWPNALTALRALLVPVILVLLLVGTDAAAWWAFGVFLFAAATDTVDGWAARRWQGVTRWGQFADPIADKLLIIGTLMTLAALGPLPWWAVIVIVVREAAVTVLRVVLVRNSGVVMPASVWGKAKTVSQVAAVAAFLLPRLPEAAQFTLLYVAVALTVVSGLDYALRAQRLAARTQAAERA
jgi:CDP-diacylglycerol---glycerol-3-phosphate 3-phosphatidyltransferase